MMLFSVLARKYDERHGLDSLTTPWRIKKNLQQLVSDMEMEDVVFRTRFCFGDVYGKTKSTYDAATDEIDITIVYNISQMILFGLRARKNVLTAILSLTHELTHRYQIYRMISTGKETDGTGSTNSTEKAYLSHPAELDAYAQDAAIHIAFVKGNWDASVRYLRRLQLENPPVIRIYRNHFGLESRVYRSFLKHVYAYLIILKENDYVRETFWRIHSS